MKKHLKAFPPFFKQLSFARKAVLVLVALAILAYFAWGIILSKGLVLIALLVLALFVKGLFITLDTLTDYFEKVKK